MDSGAGISLRSEILGPRRPLFGRLFEPSEVEFRASRDDTWIAMSTFEIPTIQITLPVPEIAEFCRRWGIVKLEVFGSVLGDDFGCDSDIDFLYTPGPEFRRDRAYGPWLSNNMADELSEMLGRKVDLIERAKIETHRNWVRREHILETAQPIYVER